MRGIQTSTCSTQLSYHKYAPAAKVQEMFQDDLRSDAARKVHRQLKDLRLPTLDDVKPEFDELANQLGVGHS